MKLQGIAGGLRKTGAEAETASGKTSALGAALRGLPATVGTTIIIEALVNKKPVDSWLKSHHLGFATKGIIPDIVGLFGGGSSAPGMLSTQDAMKLVPLINRGTVTASNIRALKDRLDPSMFASLIAVAKAAAPAVAAAAATGTPRSVTVPGPVSGRTVGRYTPEQVLQNALSGDPNNVGLLNQQVAYDRKQIAFLQRLHANNKGPGSARSAQEIQAFKTDLVSTLGTLSSISDAAAQAAKDAADKTAEARKKAAEAARKAAEAARHMIHALIGRQHESLEQYTARAERPGSFQRLGPLMASSFTVPIGLQVALAQEQATGTGMTATLKAARAAARRALRSWEALPWRRRSTRGTRSPP